MLQAGYARAGRALSASATRASARQERGVLADDQATPTTSRRSRSRAEGDPAVARLQLIDVLVKERQVQGALSMAGRCQP